MIRVQPFILAAEVENGTLDKRVCLAGPSASFNLDNAADTMYDVILVLAHKCLFCKDAF